MKKISLILVVVLILLSPVYTNMFMTKELTNNLDVLKANGVSISEEDEESSYFKTDISYELKVDDSAKFMTFIQKYSEGQLPAYVETLLKGSSVGARVSFLNIIFFSSMNVDIFPLSFSKDFMNNLHKEDQPLYAYITNALEKQVLLYHINYNIFAKEFDGYIKDIDESYTLQDSSVVSLKLLGSKFDGNGLLIAPDNLNSKLSNIYLSIKKKDEEISLTMEDFLTTSNFNSASTYVYTTNIQSINFKVKDTQKVNINVDIQKLYINLSSNTQENKAQLYMKSTLDSISISKNTEKTVLNKFNYDISISKLDKEVLEKLRVLGLRTKSSSSPELQAEIENTFIELFSKGVEILIADLSVDTIEFAKLKKLDGFSLNTDFKLKADDKLATNIKTNPQAISKNLYLNSTLVVSKELFKAFSKVSPYAIAIIQFAKEDAENLVFNLKLEDDKLFVNNKQIR